MKTFRRSDFTSCDTMLTFLNMQETREIHLPTHLREIHLRSVLIRSNSLCWLDKSLASVISYSRLLVASAHMCPYFPVAQQRYSYNLIHFSGLCIVYCTWLPFPFCCTILTVCQSNLLSEKVWYGLLLSMYSVPIDTHWFFRALDSRNGMIMV